MKGAAWFAVLWALAFLFTPGGGETASGAFLGRLIASAGIAFIVWAPVAGTLAAIRWHRRKTPF